MTDEQDALDVLSQNVHDALIGFKEYLVDAQAPVEAVRIAALSELFRNEFNRVLQHAITRTNHLNGL